MATFELTAKHDKHPTAPTGWAGLETNDLLRNARWFTLIRWGVIATLALASLVQTLLPQIPATIGLHLPALPLLIIAIGLAITNIGYILVLRRYDNTTPRRKLCGNLWAQILLDLMALTVLVHLAGCMSTFINQAYLFHIVLSCIFFAPPFSFLVTLLSGVLYLSVVILQLTGILTPCHMAIGATATAAPGNLPASLFQAFSGFIFWLAVWYLVAFIAQALRKRDRQLAEANQRLIIAEEENNRQVLRTTHDLKAPFSGIESNILLLRTLHWDALSEPVRDIIERIETRSAALRERIKDILMLGAIKSQEQGQERISAAERIDIPTLVADIVTDLNDKAEHRHIAIETTGAHGEVTSSPNHLKTLLGNLIANAIFYSHDKGVVRIAITEVENIGVSVTVSDEGIGIREDALPHIFDEYYRTNEAAQHNQMSTGLGLAIVKRIADILGLTIRVESQVDHGTTFEVVIPQGSSATKRPKSGRL